MIIKCIPGGIFLTNCYIIGDEATNEAILVDPGEQMDDILAEVEKSGLDIIKIVNTHTHIDHVAGAAEAKARAPARAAMAVMVFMVCNPRWTGATPASVP